MANQTTKIKYVTSFPLREMFSRQRVTNEMVHFDVTTLYVWMQQFRFILICPSSFIT
jgi:hypothetical protein